MATATLKNKALHSVRSVRIWSYSCPHFSAFGLKTESEYGKMWTRITPNTDTFYAVWKFCFRWKESRVSTVLWLCYAFSFISQYFLTSLNLFTFWLYYTQRLRLVPTKDKTKITIILQIKNSKDMHNLHISSRNLLMFTLPNRCNIVTQHLLCWNQYERGRVWHNVFFVFKTPNVFLDILLRYKLQCDKLHTIFNKVTKQKLKFSIKDFPGFSGFCEFGYIYWRNP